VEERLILCEAEGRLCKVVHVVQDTESALRFEDALDLCVDVEI